LEERLVKETEKLIEKLESVEFRPVSEKGEWMVKNLRAYLSDSKHFLKSDPVLAFEAVVWAWAFLEIGAELGLISLYSNRGK